MNNLQKVKQIVQWSEQFAKKLRIVQKKLPPTPGLWSNLFRLWLILGDATDRYATKTVIGIRGS